MSAINEICSICLDDFNSAERYLEGHQSNVANISHVFDPSCIRTALTSQSRCPICRDPLISSELIQLENPRFSWVAYGSRWVNNVRKILPSRTQTVCSVKKNWKQVVAVITGSMLMKDIISETVSGSKPFGSGAAIGFGSILLSGVVVVLPMICNKMANRRMINQKTVNKIFLTAVVSSAMLVGLAKIENISRAVGVIAGATLTASAAGIIGESSVFYEDGTFQMGPLSTDFTSSDYVVGQITAIGAVAVGAITTGKLISYYTVSCSGLIHTVSTLVGGILGAAAVGVGSIICAGIRLMVQSRIGFVA
jgi:hypothetical protein